MSYNIDTYINALTAAKTDFQQAVKGVDVRDAIVDQCDATKNLGIALNDDLNDAITQSFAVPDTTLTQAGKPAEAKATGDALALKADNGDCVVDSLTVGMRAGTTGQNSVVIGAGKATAAGAIASGGTASAAPSYAFGSQTKASSANQFVTGKYNVEDSNGDNLFIVGNGTADDARSNAFEVTSDGTAVAYRFSSGGSNTVTGTRAAAFGTSNTASGGYSAAVGSGNTASGGSAFAEGGDTVAQGMYSHSEGYKTETTRMYQHVQGKYNIVNTSEDEIQYAHIVGNGTGANARSNAHTIDWDGNGWFAGTVKIGGTGYSDSNAKELATKNYVDSGLSAKQAKLVVGTNLDNAPSQNSTHPITAKGVYDALRKTVTFNMRAGAGLDERINKAYHLGDMVFLSITLKTSGAFSQSDYVLGTFSGFELLPIFDTVFISCFTCADLNTRTPHPATAVIANNSGTLQLKLTATEPTDTIVQINASFAIKP